MQHDKIVSIELFNFKKCPAMTRKFLFAFSSYFCTIMMFDMPDAYVAPIQAGSIFSSFRALTFLTYLFLTCI